VPPPFEQAAPEPYLYFGDSANALVVLTTNPGGTMKDERSTEVRKVLEGVDAYAEAAPRLGCLYKKILAGSQAGYRIDHQQTLSSWLGYDGVLQVELIPFHSKTLPKKIALKKMAEDELLGDYAEHLRAFLRDRLVVGIQAVSTRASLEQETPKSSQWLTKVAEIAGLDLDGTKVKFVALVENDDKTTVAAWVSKTKPRKALVLRMGANDLPGDEGLRKLAAALR